MSKNKEVSFEILNKCNKSRRGVLNLGRGQIQTPAFMPVGTLATVKAMKNSDILATNADIILGNVYHLMLRPGADLVEKMGGLHKFMNFDKPILTDSGGFQVMSLSQIRKISDDGVEFSSHIDGKKYFLTPEKSIQIQHQLDSDITMIFDECAPFPSSYENFKNAMMRSLDWAKRSKNAYQKRDGYAIFGIQQGGIHEDLREISSKKLVEIGFDGYAIGGLAVGEGQENMFTTLDFCVDMLPSEKPRYLMGVGKPSDIVGAVLRGVDMFDCVLPTRSGRTAQAFTRPEVEGGVINIRNAKYKMDEKPLDDQCLCYACKNHSRAYLHHLTKAKEILSSMLLTEHNLFYYQKLMQDLRDAIQAGNLEEYAQKFFDKNAEKLE